MDRDRFNRDMGSYLRERKSDDREKGFNITVAGDSRPSFWDKLMEFFASGYEETEDNEELLTEDLTGEEMERLEEMDKVKDNEYVDVDDIDVPRPGFVAKLWSFLGLGESAVAYEEMEVFDPEAYADGASEQLMFEEDVKELMKITHRWIEKLPSEKKREFKASEDFDRYKQLLDKLGLLKK